MYVELLDGRYAGQSKDIAPDAAHELIKLGRAKKAFQSPLPEVAPVFAVVAEPTETPEPVRTLLSLRDEARARAAAEKKKKIR
jgi:hypothetical protein